MLVIVALSTLVLAAVAVVTLAIVWHYTRPRREVRGFPVEKPSPSRE